MAKSSIESTIQLTAELTWKQLYHHPQKIPLPFQLVVYGEDEPVLCHQIVRILPKKRIVFFATWKNTDVVVKLFYEAGRARHHIERETTGIKRLLEAGIATPEICYEGTATQFKLPVLITKKITGARDLESLWLNRTHPETTGRLMHAVIIELATQHVMGITQRDCHLGNLLIKNHRIYTLDCGSIEFQNQPLSVKMSLDHLALFFAQLGTGTQALREQLFVSYCKARGWQIKRAYMHKLDKLTRFYLRQRVADYREKVVRNSTHFCKISSPFRRVFVDRSFQSQAMQDVLKNPQSVFQQPNAILKNGNSSTVVQVIIDHHAFVIKRYNNKNLLHWLRRCIKKSSALKSWQCAHTLRLTGIPTPRPIACVEKYFLGIFRYSYFIMEYVSGPHLDECITPANLNTPEAQMIAARVTHVLHQLAELRLSHGDLKATNFIIHDERPVLIDLDAMKQHRTSYEAGQAYQKETQRLIFNWEHEPAVQAFFSKYI